MIFLRQIFNFLVVRIAIFSFLWFYFKILHRVKVVGYGNISEESGGLFYSNHPTLLDPFLILVLGFFPKCLVRPKILPMSLAAEEYFTSRIPILGRFAPFKNISRFICEEFCIFIKEGRKDTRALGEAIRALRMGKSVLIFPEGHRTRSKERLDKFRKGIGRIVYSGQPKFVVPIKIIGAEKVMSLGSKRPRWKGKEIKIIFGKPLKFSLSNERKISEERAIYSSIADELYEKIKNLD